VTKLLDVVACRDGLVHILGLNFHHHSGMPQSQCHTSHRFPAGLRFLAGPLAGSRTGDQPPRGSWFLALIRGSTNGLTAR